jgi:inner membrane protein
VDSITHALLVAAFLTITGAPEFLLFGIIGAVVLDTDILFNLFLRDHPSLYVFSHGGAAHSITGAIGMAFIAYTILFLVTFVSGMVYPSPFSPPFGPYALLCVIIGALVHVVLDFLASPGIPLFWPLTDKKYTLGIFAGPSLVMIVVSWVFLILFLFTGLPLSALFYYGILFLTYLTVSVILRIIAALRVSGKTYPTLNPFRWLVIVENTDGYSVRFFTLLTRAMSDEKYYPKYSGTSAPELEIYSAMPEVRRVKYNSYFTIAERRNDIIIIKDPLREEGIIRYPPNYSRVMIQYEKESRI